MVTHPGHHAGVTVSQNNWPVDPPRTYRPIPGTTVRVTIADGPAGDVLMYVLEQIDRRVEDIDLNSTRGEFDDWGYAPRNVRGSTEVSNHASATAVDVNATRHPLGAIGTFSPVQVAEIHRILAEVDHVVRWGGDYTGRRDEMHFEIVGTQEEVARVAGRLRQQAAGEPFMSLPQWAQNMILEAAKRTLGWCQQRWFRRNPDGTITPVAAGAPGAIPAGGLDTLDGNYLVTQMADLRARMIRAEQKIDAGNAEQVDENELRALLEEDRQRLLAEWDTISERENPDDVILRASTEANTTNPREV